MTDSSPSHQERGKPFSRVLEIAVEDVEDC